MVADSIFACSTLFGHHYGSTTSDDNNDLEMNTADNKRRKISDDRTTTATTTTKWKLKAVFCVLAVVLLGYVSFSTESWHATNNSSSKMNQGEVQLEPVFF
jgi:hypothetical protein